MNAWTFTSRDPDETRAFGRALGRAIGDEGLAIALVGPLGAGKTVFVKGLAEGLGVDPRVVSSPTFVIAQQYIVPKGPEALHHVDLYRLESEQELESIGFYDMLAPGSVLAVEWADRFPDVLGREHLRIELEGPSALEGAGEEDGDETGDETSEEVCEESGAGGAIRVGRTARVQASGARAMLVLEDWARYSDRESRSRAGVGTFVEMRLLSSLVLAFGLLVGALFGEAGDPLQGCESLRSVEADHLGTLRLECVEESTPGDPRASGVAQLLAGAPIDLNLAPVALLETLPGIGPVRARAIAGARPFESVAELERVPGIGPKTRTRLERWLVVDPSTIRRDSKTDEVT